jgi:hypothetical protein
MFSMSSSYVLGITSQKSCLPGAKSRHEGMPPPSEDEAAMRAEGVRITDEIKRRITPQLQEMGVTGFVICGYMVLGDGTKSRLLLVSDGGDPSIADGLRPLAHAGAVWGGLFNRLQPPHENPQG